MKDEDKKSDSHEHYIRAGLSKSTKFIIGMCVIIVIVYIALPIILNAVYGNFFPLIRGITLIFALAGPTLFLIFIVVMIVNAIKKIRK